MYKKAISLILAVVLCIGMMPATTLAADSDFVIENGVLKSYVGKDSTVVIPDGVTTIGSRAFENLGKTGVAIEMLYIPASVMRIEVDAFEINMAAWDNLIFFDQTTAEKPLHYITYGGSRAQWNKARVPLSNPSGQELYDNMTTYLIDIYFEQSDPETPTPTPTSTPTATPTPTPTPTPTHKPSTVHNDFSWLKWENANAAKWFDYVNKWVDGITGKDTRSEADVFYDAIRYSKKFNDRAATVEMLTKAIEFVRSDRAGSDAEYMLTGFFIECETCEDCFKEPSAGDLCAEIVEWINAAPANSGYYELVGGSTVTLLGRVIDWASAYPDNPSADTLLDEISDWAKARPKDRDAQGLLARLAELGTAYNKTPITADELDEMLREKVPSVIIAPGYVEFVDYNGIRNGGIVLEDGTTISWSDIVINPRSPYTLEAWLKSEWDAKKAELLQTYVIAEPDTEQHFADVSPDAWYYEAVNTMAEAGILNGKEDGLFHPDDYITDGEFATILTHICYESAQTYKSLTDEVVKKHPDTAQNPSHWAAKAIIAAFEGPTNKPQNTGLLYSGVDWADKYTTRGRVFEVISRYAYSDQFIGKYSYRDFVDMPHLSQSSVYYYPHLLVNDDEAEKIYDKYEAAEGVWMDWEHAEVVYLGIIHGDENGNLNLTDNITRAELCQVLYNMGATIDWLGEAN